MSGSYSYARNAWYVAGWVSDLTIGKPMAMSILGIDLAIWLADDDVVAFEDRCPHRLAPLSLGRCEGRSLRCMYHGMLFDTDGVCVEVPGQEQPPRAKVRTFPVVARSGWVWVWMGEPALADVALVPEVFGPDDPDWMLGSGQLDYAAEARLINENLLDLSHVSFVHQSSIKGGPAFSAALPKWEKLPRGLRYSRWMTNVTQVSGGETRNLADAGPVDEFLTYDFLIPGILVMYTGVFPQGTAVEFGHRAPDRSRAIGGVSVSSQAVTPMRDRSTRYFFSAGPSRAQGTEAIRQLQVELAQKAFAEDKVMIEAQQRVIDRAGDTRVIPTAHDKPITLFNAMVQRLDGIASNPEAAR